MEQKCSPDTSIENLHALYTECMNCEDTADQYPGGWKDIDNGLPPRGFHYELAPAQVFVGAKNPGHPLYREPYICMGLRDKKLLQAYRDFHDLASTFKEIIPGVISNGSDFL